MNIPSLALVAALAVAACSPPQPADVLVENVTIIDASGAREAPATVVVRAGLIDEILPPHDAAAIPADTRLDGTGRYLIPGLWDTHVHLESASARPTQLDSLLAWGVTTARDLGAVGDSVPVWKAEIAAGSRKGPRLITVGMILNGAPLFDDAPWHRFVLTEEEARAAVAHQVAAGADVIKIHRQLAPELLPVVIEEAERHDLKVVGHIPYGMTPLQACEAGQAEVVHVVAIAEAILNRNDPPPPGFVGGLNEMRGPETDAFRACMVARDMYFAPNLSMDLPIIAAETDAQRRQMTENLLGALTEAVGIMHDAEVTMVLGTDAGAGDITFGPSAHDELELMVGAGLTPLEALTAATLNPSRFHGVADRVGTVEVGMAADLVLLAGDPLEDIRNTREIEAVIAAGSPVTR